MSEFKFACPVCGQHITADSTASGTPLECPTCFQTLLVPSAPAFGDRKLILTAAKAGPLRKTSAGGSIAERAQDSVGKRRNVLLPLALLAGTGTIAFLLWHERLTGLANTFAEHATKPGSNVVEAVPFQSPHPVPANITWTLNATNAWIPDAAVAGSIHGQGFLCDRAVLKGDRLSLRQGPAGHPDLGISVTLPVQTAQELSGKTFLVNPAVPVSTPRVVLRWKDEQREPVTEHIHSGYAMKLLFGRIADSRIYGRIYIALPDEHKSFAAGNFEAEITQRTAPLAGVSSGRDH